MDKESRDLLIGVADLIVEFLKERSQEQKKENSEERMRQFEVAKAIELHEAGVVWQCTQTYLTANTFFSALIGTSYIVRSSDQNNLIILLFTLVGIAICVLWFLSYERLSTYYRFRIAEAKKLEPYGWHIYSGAAEKLSSGHAPVEVGGKWFSLMGSPSNLTVIRLLIFVFMSFYIFLASKIFLPFLLC